MLMFRTIPHQSKAKMSRPPMLFSFFSGRSTCQAPPVVQPLPRASAPQQLPPSLSQQVAQGVPSREAASPQSAVRQGGELAATGPIDVSDEQKCSDLGQSCWV